MRASAPLIEHSIESLLRGAGGTARAGQALHPPLRVREIEQLNSVRKLLHCRIGSPPTLKELTLATGIHANRLSAGFKGLFGCTIYQYALDVRMRKALELLLSGQYSVSQVSDSVGYEEVPSFSRMFKMRFGKAPSDITKVPNDMSDLTGKAGALSRGGRGTAVSLGEI